MLKAHSRLLEHLMLAADLCLVALCWLAAYGLRFYVVGPPLVTPEVPRLRDYLATERSVDAPGHFIVWLSEQEPVYGWRSRGNFFDIGSLNAYHAASAALAGDQQ